MSENSGIEICGIKKVFPTASGENLEVLSDINLSIRKGEFVSIVGASGCGKSTLIRMIAGLENPTNGTIKVEARTVTKPSIEVGLIFQESRLFPWLTVEQNIAFGIHRKLGKEEKKKLVQQYIDLVELTGFEKAKPSQLSGGMQQRVSIARTLINKPDVLLLDEPFGALDALTRINMQNAILKIWEIEKTTMVLITHDIDEAIFLSDRIVIMSNRPGIISMDIPVEQLKPRDRSSIYFMNIRRKIYTEFFDNSDVDIEYYI